ncbi:MAG: biliverdin-producing heme oxygenase [Anaerolineales bacterium]|nr:biliverdin-producing heme oxygenase [Anaerolineales bacterium]MCS7248657.1 biliverdin-producing heme oxygenase [Anaerolineales bacterium]MDW8162470.1 biliverdin-producing heme oxygenase [Anaerolineales bacterium]MDW8447905.1 biliverdin-producing heme oxygenase [Anaerolineales bacterium]
MVSGIFPPLSVRLREGTREAHRRAESAPFMRELFSGRLPLAAYRVFLVQLYSIYSALETGAELLQPETSLRTFYLPALFRCTALERDLGFFFGDESWRKIMPLPATQAYVRRIETVAREWHLGLLAHHYTRYLGDLSGGQVVKRIVAKMYSLDSDEGLAFYNFPQIPDYTAFKDEYRARLDALPIDEVMARRIVAEANLAFELNRQVFTEMMEYLSPPSSRGIRV